MSRNQTLTLSRIGKALLAILAAAILPSCGGGGEDTSPPTVRPKTLEDLAITLFNGPRLQFIRGATSPKAISSGDTETGTLLYALAADNIQQYTTVLSGDPSNQTWPDDLLDISYEYTAINNNQALLTIYARNNDDRIDTGDLIPGPQPVYWLYDSVLPIPNIIEEVQFDLNFLGNGATITLNDPTVRIPGTGRPDLDIVTMPAEILTKDGDPVVENYNPTVDPNEPSDIAQPSLNNLNLVCTNGIPNATFDIIMTFVATTITPPESKLNPLDPDEIGTFILRVNLAGPVIGAGAYTYRRINGTDEAILVLSGSMTTFDGNYTLAYAGRDNGDYIGEADGGTPDPAEVSGTFFIPAAPDFVNP